MTPERIAELRALCEAATPGPWTVEGDDRRRPDGGRVYFPSVRLTPGDPTFPAFGRIVINEGPTMDACVAAAGLIAAARTALPEAIDEIERLRALRDDLLDSRDWERAEADGLRAEIEWLRAELANLQPCPVCR